MDAIPLERQHPIPLHRHELQTRSLLERRAFRFPKMGCGALYGSANPWATLFLVRGWPLPFSPKSRDGNGKRANCQWSFHVRHVFCFSLVDNQSFKKERRNE
jgi:hypothetical protein